MSIGSTYAGLPAVSVSSGVPLIRRGLERLLATHAAHPFTVVEPGGRADVAVLDLTGHAPPPPEHFAPLWVHRVPALGLVEPTGPARVAARALGCHATLDLDFSGAQFDAAATTLASMARRARHVSTEALTWRELQVLHLVSRGHPNKVVAARLLIGENTVKTYVRQAYRKIEVTTRSQATLWASVSSLSSVSAEATLLGGPGPGAAAVMGPTVEPAAEGGRSAG